MLASVFTVRLPGKKMVKEKFNHFEAPLLENPTKVFKTTAFEKERIVPLEKSFQIVL